MTLEKAIEILQYSFTDPRFAPKDNFADAIKLGIEALGYIQRSRMFGEYPVCRELPRETED